MRMRGKLSVFTPRLWAQVCGACSLDKGGRGALCGCGEHFCLFIVTTNIYFQNTVDLINRVSCSQEIVEKLLHLLCIWKKLINWFLIHTLIYPFCCCCWLTGISHHWLKDQRGEDEHQHNAQLIVCPQLYLNFILVVSTETSPAQ